jgi:hypothetical protein
MRNRALKTFSIVLMERLLSGLLGGLLGGLLCERMEPLLSGLVRPLVGSERGVLIADTNHIATVIARILVCERVQAGILIQLLERANLLLKDRDEVILMLVVRLKDRDSLGEVGLLCINKHLKICGHGGGKPNHKNKNSIFLNLIITEILTRDFKELINDILSLLRVKIYTDVTEEVIVTIFARIFSILRIIVVCPCNKKVAVEVEDLLGAVESDLDQIIVDKKRSHG